MDRLKKWDKGRKIDYVHKMAGVIQKTDHLVFKPTGTV